MSEPLSEAQRHWQACARALGDEVVRPVAAQWDRHEADAIPSIELIRGMDRFGLRTLGVPRELGGPGADFMTHCLVMEEIGAADFGTAILASQVYRWTPVITHAMDDAQRARYLPRLLGDPAFFVAGALTEPGSGSDNQRPYDDPAIGVSSPAVREGEGWLLNGRKQFINGGGIASLYAILMRTDPARPAHVGSTFFLVEANAPGFRVVRQHDKMAGRLGPLAELALENCRLLDAQRLGPVNAGRKTLDIGLRGRLFDAAECVGLAREALRVGTRWARERRQGGKRLIEHQAMAMLLAETAVEVEAARALTWRAATMADRGETGAFDLSNAAKHFAAETGLRASRRLLDMHGGYGVMRDYPAEKLWRDSASMPHIGGTQQMVLLRIADQLDASFGRESV